MLIINIRTEITEIEFKIIQKISETKCCYCEKQTKWINLHPQSLKKKEPKSIQ